MFEILFRTLVVVVEKGNGCFHYYIEYCIVRERDVRSNPDYISSLKSYMKIQYRYIDIDQNFFYQGIFLVAKSNEVCQPNRSKLYYSNLTTFFYCVPIFILYFFHSPINLWRNLFFLRSFKFFSMPLSWVAVTLLRFCGFHM